MRTVKTGQVERTIWWNGIETIASDTLDAAILTVNSTLNASSVACWPDESFESEKVPDRRSR
jgi:hypothetical protein